MDICISYLSKFGNGKKCVDYLEKILKEKKHNVHVLSITDTKPDALPDSDLYIFSTPTKMGGAPGKIKKFIKDCNFKKNDAKFSLIVTGLDNKTKVADKLSAILGRRGIKMATNGVKIIVGDIKGPLEENFQKKLDNFMLELPV